MKLNKTCLLFFITVVFIILSCDKSPTGLNATDEILTEDTFIFDVEWTPNTVYFDSTALSTLQKVDTTDFRYYFAASDQKASALTPGEIIVLHRLALRKVISVATINQQIVIETEYATLNEAINNGQIEWDYGINFTKPIVPHLLQQGKAIAYNQISADSFGIEKKIGEFTYKISMKFNDSSADVKCEIEKDVGGIAKISFKCEGAIEQFRTSSKIDFENSQLTNYEQKNDDLKGDLTVSLAAAGSGNDKLKLEFPATLLKFPIFIGPVPAIINIKVLFIAEAVVPLDGSSRISAKFTYDSSTGIKYNGTSVEVNGNIGTYSIEKNITQTGASGRIGINFGLGFPRLEIGLFGIPIVPWVHTAFLIGGDYTFNPACQQAKAAFIGACGYDLGFFGVGFSGSKTLWNEEKILLQSGDCGSG